MNPRARTAAALGALIAVAALFQLACGGSSTPLNPSLPVDAVTITIAGQNGNLSFKPNPASAAIGQAVVWKNTDAATTHRIVADDGAWDTGNLPAGAMSLAIIIGAAGTFPYHCLIHPTEVGTLNGTAAAATAGAGF